MSTAVNTDHDPDAYGDGENSSIEHKETEGLSQSAIVWRKFIRHTGAIAGLSVFGLVAVLAFTAQGVGPIPGWWIHGHQASNPILNPSGAPTWTLADPFSPGVHPFGQDEIGRDNFARVMKGTQISIMVMLIIGAISMVIGTLVGALAGFYRGWLDSALMRITDGFIILPTIVVGAILGKLVSNSNAVMLGIALGAILWTGLARLVRGEFLALREREFVDSARVAGASDVRIMFKHMLPNALGVVIVNTTLLMSQAIVLETALSFLGFGISSPEVSLGSLINEYQTAFSTRPWLFWWPGLFIIVVALCINFIGDGLRDANDPRQKKIPSQRQMDRAAKRESEAPAAGGVRGDTVTNPNAAKPGQRPTEE